MSKKSDLGAPTQVKPPRAPNKTSNINERKRGGGRPRGAMNKEKVQIRDFCRDTLLDPTYQKNIAAVIRRCVPDEIKKISNLVVLMHYYAFGRPKATIAIEATQGAVDMLAGKSTDEVKQTYEVLRRLRSGEIIDMQSVPAFEPVLQPALPEKTGE